MQPCCGETAARPDTPALSPRRLCRPRDKPVRGTRELLYSFRLKSRARQRVPIYSRLFPNIGSKGGRYKGGRDSQPSAPECRTALGAVHATAHGTCHGETEQVSGHAMTLTLAFRNLFHDRVRLAVTLIGILFSIVLVAVQLGLYLGARTMIISTIDRSDSDLWVMAYGTKNFEEAQPINTRERFTVLATPGVASATPLVTSFTDWRKPGGGTTLVVVIGTDYE